MKQYLVLALLGLASLQAIGDQPGSATAPGPATSKAPSPLATSTAQVAGATTIPAYQLVESLIKNPRFLEKPWSEMRKAYPAGCSKPDDSPDLTCPFMEGVVRLSATASGSGIVDVVFSDPVTCEGLYDVISRRFGAGQIEGGNKCAATWKLGQWVKRGHLRVSKGKKDPSKIFFQMAIEQGP